MPKLYLKARTLAVGGAVVSASAATFFQMHLHGLSSGPLPLNTPSFDPWGFGIRAVVITSVFALPVLVGVLLLQACEVDAKSCRARGGLCVACGYPLETLDACPECGLKSSTPVRRHFLTITLIYMLLCIPLTTAGLALADWYVASDEAAFRSEALKAKQSGLTEYYRGRAWPNDNSALCWSADRGFWCTD